KLLEEILSFRMQGVEFDNGDMYVDGHKAASDVRDEFVSVTEKLMDELAQCYNVLPQLDINNTTSRGSISTSTLPSIKLRKCSSKIITSILSFISGRLATKSNQIKQLIRNGRSASLQRTFKKSFTSFSHS